MFGVVMVELVSNADGLGKETRIVWKVEFAGQEAALLEDVGDVATRAVCPALRWTISGVLAVARVGGGGKVRVAFWTRLGMVRQWYW